MIIETQNRRPTETIYRKPQRKVTKLQSKNQHLVSSQLQKNTWPRWAVNLTLRYGHVILFFVFSFFYYYLNYLNTTYNTKQLQVLLTLIQYTSPTLQINMTTGTYSNYNPIYTLLTKIIRYLHPYCNNEQQNKDNLITYQTYNSGLYTTCHIMHLNLRATTKKIHSY